MNVYCYEKHSVCIAASSVFVVKNSETVHIIYTIACPLHYENNIVKKFQS